MYRRNRESNKMSEESRKGIPKAIVVGKIEISEEKRREYEKILYNLIEQQNNRAKENDNK